jgi:hypothetical protein
MKTPVSASEGNRRVTQADVYAKEPAPLQVPVREIDTLESIALGFRVEMFSLEGEDFRAAVATGSGFGNTSIQLEWNGRKAVISGVELLAAWAATFDEQGAARIPDGAK